MKENGNKLANYRGIILGIWAIVKSIIDDFFLALLKSIMLNFWSIIASSLYIVHTQYMHTYTVLTST